VKIGDFGIAKVLLATLQKAQTIAGTPCYFSPEIVKN
jgi:serine/threonine protein kinase